MLNPARTATRALRTVRPAVRGIFPGRPWLEMVGTPSLQVGCGM